MPSQPTQEPLEAQAQTILKPQYVSPSLRTQLKDQQASDSGWNTPLPRKPTEIRWRLQSARNGHWLSSDAYRWSSLSIPVELDPGFSVYGTKELMHVLYLDLADLTLPLAAGDGPCQYFAFDRHAHCLFDTQKNPESQRQEPQWLYSVYGYIQEHQLVCVRYRPTQELELLVLPRPVQFPW